MLEEEVSLRLLSLVLGVFQCMVIPLRNQIVAYTFPPPDSECKVVPDKDLAEV